MIVHIRQLGSISSWLLEPSVHKNIYVSFFFGGRIKLFIKSTVINCPCTILIVLIVWTIHCRNIQIFQCMLPLWHFDWADGILCVDGCCVWSNNNPLDKNLLLSLIEQEYLYFIFSGEIIQTLVIFSHYIKFWITKRMIQWMKFNVVILVGFDTVEWLMVCLLAWTQTTNSSELLVCVYNEATFGKFCCCILKYFDAVYAVKIKG